MSEKKENSPEEEFAAFLEHHKNEIFGLYRDKWYKNGGWNGMMDALCEVGKRYKIEFDFDVFEEGKFEEIVNEFLF